MATCFSYAFCFRHEIIDARSAMSPRKRKQLSLEKKIQILRDVETGVKKKDVAEKYGVPPSTLSTTTILKAKESIEDSYNQQAIASGRKKLHRFLFPDVEQALLSWFKDARARNIPVSGALLQRKAQDLALLLGHKEEDFAASSGWLQRFRSRHEISCHVASGESACVDRESCEKWLERVQPVLAKYEERDVYNVDETGVFFKLLPERSLSLNGEKCHGGKRSKDRVTALVATNMDGSDKRKLTVIGKSQRPRCFKDMHRMPVEYRANTKAWLTTQLFEQWLIEFDKDMQKQGRRVLLVLDNCSSHMVSTPLRVVNLLFLPPNTTLNRWTKASSGL